MMTALTSRDKTVTAYDIILALFRRWRLFALVYTGVLVAVALRAFVVAPQFRAAAKILLTSNHAEVSTTPDRPTEFVRNERVLPEELNTQIEILRSRAVLERVLREHPMATASSLADEDTVLARLGGILAYPVQVLGAVYQWFHGLEPTAVGDPMEEELARIAASLEVAALNRSNIIEVAFTSADAAWARDFIDRLTTAYIEHHAELRQVGEAESFFTKQSQLFQQKLAASEQRLRAEREKAGALSGRRDEVLNRLQLIAADLTATTVSRAEAEGRVAFLAAGRKEPTERIATPELLELEAERAALLGRFQPDSERVRTVDKQIRTLRAAIGGYDVVTAAGGGSSTSLLSSRAELAALKAKEQALVRELDEHKRLATQLHAHSFDIERLERQVSVDEGAYLSYVRAAEESRLSTALERSKLLHLSIVEAASVPAEPVSPRIPRLLAFAVVGGLLFGLLVALLRDYLDTTIRSAEDIRRYVGLEVLAVVEDRA